MPGKKRDVSVHGRVCECAVEIGHWRNGGATKLESEMDDRCYGD